MKRIIIWSDAHSDIDYSQEVDMSDDEFESFIKNELRDRSKRLITVYHDDKGEL